MSPFQAGIRLLPFAVSVPVGSLLQSIVATRLKVLPTFVLLAGAILQIIGAALMSTLPTELNPAQYGYQVISGIGLGLNLGVLILLTPFVIRGKNTGKISNPLAPNTPD